MYLTDMNKIYADINSGKLKYLGRGAGRRVYDMGNGYVVKLAKNNFGYRQNKFEYGLSQVYKGDLLAKVHSVSEGYRMLVMESAQTINSMTPVLNYFNVRTVNELFKIPPLAALVRTHNLSLREFSRPWNWGLINGKPVIIDYGLTSWR